MKWVLSPDRNYDILASFYATPVDNCWLLDAADYVTSGGLSKFHAAKLLAAHLLAGYRGVWFIDDDIDFHFEPGEFLNFVDAQGFSLAQPALTHESYASHPITLLHPTCVFRETNFVEVMAPYFSRALLSEAITDFDLSISTWGLDFIWGAKYAPRRLAIVDALTMTHTTRVDPANGPFYRYLREIGVDPYMDMRRAFQYLGIQRFDIVNLKMAFRAATVTPPAIAPH